MKWSCPSMCVCMLALSQPNCLTWPKDISRAKGQSNTCQFWGNFLSFLHSKIQIIQSATSETYHAFWAPIGTLWLQLGKWSWSSMCVCMLALSQPNCLTWPKDISRAKGQSNTCQCWGNFLSWLHSTKYSNNSKCNQRNLSLDKGWVRASNKK